MLRLLWTYLRLPMLLPAGATEANGRMQQIQGGWMADGRMGKGGRGKGGAAERCPSLTHQSYKAHRKIRKDLGPSRQGSSRRHLLFSALDTAQNSPRLDGHFAGFSRPAPSLVAVVRPRRRTYTRQVYTYTRRQPLVPGFHVVRPAMCAFAAAVAATARTEPC